MSEKNATISTSLPGHGIVVEQQPERPRLRLHAANLEEELLQELWFTVVSTQSASGVDTHCPFQNLF
ncbi:hypothetical protein Taro_046861 [Colocasia esculenta]|uniref:Uncharacterized protein n=1 Tax=Colocasia esculenta TaxID=4460 RepID=A0A843X6M0_COLES|nr:hypothetical protein [Colocasia esculenta]